MAFWKKSGFFNFIEAFPVSNKDLARSIEESSETLAKSITEASKDEIKARDRVDITLEEYEQLKEEVKVLRQENRELRNILGSFRFPINLWRRVKQNTIKTSVCHNVRDFIDTVRIEFDVDVLYPYGEDYDY